MCYVQDHSNKKQGQLFTNLKAKQLHNTSWSDGKNLIAVKNAKQGAKWNQPVTSSIFDNLHDLSIALDANSATEDSFVAIAERIKQKSVDHDDSPLWNITVLCHDIREQEWSHIVVTFPSALEALQKLQFLWNTEWFSLRSTIQRDSGMVMLGNLAWLAPVMLTESFILSSLAFKALKMDQEVHYFFLLQQKCCPSVWPFLPVA
jgi:hypothetical protein